MPYEYEHVWSSAANQAVVLGIGPVALTGLTHGVRASTRSNHHAHSLAESAAGYLDIKERSAVLCNMGVHPVASSRCRSGMGLRRVWSEGR